MKKYKQQYKYSTKDRKLQEKRKNKKMNICISTTAVGMRIAAELRKKEMERAKGMLALAEEMGIHCIVRGKDSPEMLELVMLKETGAERRETYHV